jgi:SAM-dependent methyltransferase
MDKTLATQLAKLNQDFYKKTANSFDQTRRRPWEGWDRLATEIRNSKFENQNKSESPNSKSKTLTIKNKLAAHGSQLKAVLDLGCGNARFAEFLSQHYSKLKYVGIDFSRDLLQKAETTLEKTDFEYNLIYADLLSNWEKEVKEKFDLVVAFGLFHHIPGFENRKKLFQKMVNLTNKTGIIVITAWQFVNMKRFEGRILNKEQIKEKLGLDTSKFEKNDYILDWQRDTVAYRYCHYLDDEEIKELTGDSIKLTASFESDGKSGKANKYFILGNGI